MPKFSDGPAPTKRPANAVAKPTTTRQLSNVCRARRPCDGCEAEIWSRKQMVICAWCRKAFHKHCILRHEKLCNARVQLVPKIHPTWLFRPSMNIETKGACKWCAKATSPDGIWYCGICHQDFHEECLKEHHTFAEIACCDHDNVNVFGSVDMR